MSGTLAAAAASFVVKRASSSSTSTVVPIAEPSIWGRIKAVPIEYPMSFGVVISTIKTSVSDLLVQKVVEQRAEVDWKRNAAFATFGCFYLGGVQYLIYVPLFGRLFPNAAQFASKPLREKVKDFKGIRDLLGQVFLDQCVHHPFMYFPAFYCTKELVMQEKPSLPRVLGEYRANMKDDLIALWKVWVPSTLVSVFKHFQFCYYTTRINFLCCS